VLSQTAKFLTVTRYLLRQYGRAFVSDREAREFFTQIYLKENPAGSRQKGLGIPTRALKEIFPGIERLHLRLFNQFETLQANRYLRSSDSLMSPVELSALCALVAHLRPASIFEIGTYRGLTLANLALNAPEDCRIQTLDNYHFELEEPVAAIFSERGVGRLHTNSKDYDFSGLRGSVDFVFVDGSHEAPEVEVDSENALKIVSPRGLVLWHDFHPDHPEVVRFLTGLASTERLTHIAGTSLVLCRSSTRAKPAES